MIFDTKTHHTTEEFLRQAARELSQADPVMGTLVRRVGPCRFGFPKRNHYFASLVEAIIYQQLDRKSVV